MDAFILPAKAACCVGHGAAAAASRIESNDLTLQDGDLTYRDSYFGGMDFIGQEVVWQAARPIWAMNYFGRILRDDLMTAVDGGAVIRAALSALCRAGRFPGGLQHSHGAFNYQD